MTRFATLVPILMILAACSTLPGAAPAVGRPAPGNPDAEVRPDLMVVEPGRVAPGEVVALGFPEETSRGILFVLERRVDDGWAALFYLRSNGPGRGWEMSWSSVGGPDIAVEDIAVGGPGPDHVPIPDAARPGEYRICTGNAGDEFCAEIEVVEP